MESNYRPLGGISALLLGVASLDGAAPTPLYPFSQIPLLEDRSLYTEEVDFVGDLRRVKHHIRFFTSIDYELPESLRSGLERGFFAQIMLQARVNVYAGWSKEALSDRPLRLVSCSVNCGAKRASRGYKEWLLESIDSTSNI